MATLDYAAFFGYLIAVILLGLRFRSRARSADEFFLAGRSMHWVPVGLSVMVTMFSAINYTAFPNEVFGHGLYVMIALPVFVLVAVPVTRIFMPFYHGMKLTSAYEYLEKRFDVRVRCLASGLFVLWRLFWMATALYASSKVLSLVTGMDLRLLIIVGGAAATVYTVLGGMRAVMWTDVAQFVVLFAGIVAGVILAFSQARGGIAGVIRTAHEGGLFKPFAPFDPEFFSFDPRIRITFWSGLVGVMTAFLARYGFAARSLKDAQRGFRLNVIAVLLSLSLLTLMGFAVYAHAANTGALSHGPVQPMKQFAIFVRSLPYGVSGLLAAGLLAATMSSIDSGVNACSAAYLTDFHQRLTGRKNAGAQENGRLRRRLTAGLGLLIIAAAISLIYVVGRRQTLFALVNKVINGMGSPLLALILLGMFSRRANSTGMFTGGICGTLWSVYVSFFVKGVALHYYAVLNLVGTIAACLFFSYLVQLRGGGSTDAQLAWLWRPNREPGN